MNKRINVLVANPFAQATSGNDEVLTRLMAEIDRDRFRFIVVQPGESRYADEYRRLGATVEIMPMSIIKRNLSLSFLSRYFLGFLPTVYKFSKLIRRYSVDVVHTNTTQILGAGAAAGIMGKPSIYHVHSVNIEKPEWVAKLMALWIKFTSDRLLSNSRASGEVFVRRGYPQEKLVVLYNPIDVARFDMPDAGKEIRAEWGAGDGPLIGMVARIAPVKGMEHFIDAAALVARDYPDAGFVIVGDADGEENIEYFQSLKDQVERLGLGGKFIFAGRRDDIPRVLSALDALALTSSSEGFGLALVEGMAAGLPVVGSRVGGLPEVISEGIDGYLAPYGDPRAIADAFRKILSDPDQAARMGSAGREKVIRLFAADRLAKVLEDVYLSLITPKRKASL